MSRPDEAAPRVVAVLLAEAAGAPVRSVERVVAVAGRGLEGDRYASGRGAFSRFPGRRREVSIVAEEDVRAVARAAGRPVEAADLRRNLVVRGVDLRTLFRTRVRIGEALLEIVGPCDPCAYLERASGIDGLVEHMKRRGGLRAQIVEGGTIAVGDALVVEASAGGRLP
jgi:MOSC domain-containing protein YiiM